MLSFSWILRRGQVLGSWEWGVGSQGRAEVTGGRDSPCQGESHRGAGRLARLPCSTGNVHQSAPWGRGWCCSHPPTSLPRDQEAGGYPSCSLMLLSDPRSPALLDTPSPGACAALFHHSLLPSSLLSPGHSPLSWAVAPFLSTPSPELWSQAWISGPQPFGHQGPASWKTVFPLTGGGGKVLG